MRYYLESSALSMMCADDAPDKRAVTEAMMVKMKKEHADLYISDIVLQEFEQTPEANRRAGLFALLARHRLAVLPVTAEVRRPASRYVAEKLIPRRYEADALHIAAAAVHHVDVVISWNLEHIVKLKVRRGVEAVNLLLGYPKVDIVTPEEVW